MGENLPLAVGGDLEVVAGLARQAAGAALHQTLRVLRDPGMIARQVVGHEIKHQAQAQSPQPAAQRSQSLVAAQRRIDSIGVDGVGGAHHIFFGIVGQSIAVFLLKPGRSRATLRPSGLRSQTPISQTASKP